MASFFSKTKLLLSVFWKNKGEAEIPMETAADTTFCKSNLQNCSSDGFQFEPDLLLSFGTSDPGRVWEGHLSKGTKTNKMFPLMCHKILPFRKNVFCRVRTSNPGSASNYHGHVVADCECWLS